MKPGGAHKLWGCKLRLHCAPPFSMAQLHAHPDIDSNGWGKGIKEECSDSYIGFNTKLLALLILYLTCLAGQVVLPCRVEEKSGALQWTK